MDPRPEADDPGLPDICDLCHQAFPAGEGVYGRVRDSSWADPADPEHDGRRPITACGTAHLADLQQRYLHRPFVNEELWAAKIDRAQTQHPHLSQEQLAKETGLNLLQLEAAARWGATRRVRGADALDEPLRPPGE